MGEPAGQSESGAEFRKKFEELQAERNALAQVSREMAASAFKYVQPEDFEGVDPDKYVEHAKKVSETRAQQREEMFAEMAKEKGLDVQALSSGGDRKSPKSDAASRIASFGELSGRPPAPPDPTEGLEGRALLEALYAAEEAGQS